MKKAPEHMAPNSRSLKNQKLEGKEKKKKKEMYLNDIQGRTKDLLEVSVSIHDSVLSKWRGSN